MHLSTKNTLKNNRNYTPKHAIVLMIKFDVKP
jgi:hypothetical protein